MKIYLVMAKSRVRGSEVWNKPDVVYATESKSDAEKDALKYNKEDLKDNSLLEFNYFVQEIKFYKKVRAEE